MQALSRPTHALFVHSCLYIPHSLCFSLGGVLPFFMFQRLWIQTKYTLPPGAALELCLGVRRLSIETDAVRR